MFWFVMDYENSRHRNHVVLFMIFFYDFVYSTKRIMSQACWLFTLKMTIQALGNRDIPYRGFLPNR